MNLFPFRAWRTVAADARRVVQCPKATLAAAVGDSPFAAFTRAECVRAKTAVVDTQATLTVLRRSDGDVEHMCLIAATQSPPRAGVAPRMLPFAAGSDRLQREVNALCLREADGSYSTTQGTTEVFVVDSDEAPALLALAVRAVDNAAPVTDAALVAMPLSKDSVFDEDTLAHVLVADGQHATDEATDAA